MTSDTKIIVRESPTFKVVHEFNPVNVKHKFNGKKKPDELECKLLMNNKVAMNDEIYFVKDFVNLDYCSAIWNFHMSGRDDRGFNNDIPDELFPNMEFKMMTDGRFKGHYALDNHTIVGEISVPQTNQSRINFTKQFDIAIAFTPDTNPMHSGTKCVLFGRRNAGTGIEIGISLVSGSYRPYVETTINTVTTTTTGTTTEFNRNNVNHLEVSRDQNGLITMYVNGIPDATTITTNANLNPASAEITFVADYAGANVFKGYLHQVRLYCGTVLSETDRINIQRAKPNPFTMSFGGRVWDIQDKTTYKIVKAQAFSGDLDNWVCDDTTLKQPLEYSGIKVNWMRVNTANNYVYLVEKDISDRIAIWDGANDAFIGDVLELGGTIRSLAVDPVYNKIYVSISASERTPNARGGVWIMDGDTLALIKFLPIDDAGDLKVNTTTHEVWVCSGNTGTIKVISAGTGLTQTISHIITIPFKPTCVAVNSTTNKIYVAHGSRTGNSVDDYKNPVVIDGDTHAISATLLNFLVCATDIQVNETLTPKLLYVVDDFHSLIDIWDLDNNKLYYHSDTWLNPKNGQVGAAGGIKNINIDLTNNFIYYCQTNTNINGASRWYVSPAQANWLNGASFINLAGSGTRNIYELLGGSAFNPVTKKMYVASLRVNVGLYKIDSTNLAARGMVIDSFSRTTSTIVRTSTQYKGVTYAPLYQNGTIMDYLTDALSNMNYLYNNGKEQFLLKTSEIYKKKNYILPKGSFRDFVSLMALIENATFYVTPRKTIVIEPVTISQTSSQQTDYIFDMDADAIPRYNIADDASNDTVVMNDLEITARFFEKRVRYTNIPQGSSIKSYSIDMPQLLGDENIMLGVAKILVDSSNEGQKRYVVKSPVPLYHIRPNLIVEVNIPAKKMLVGGVQAELNIPKVRIGAVEFEYPSGITMVHLGQYVVDFFDLTKSDTDQLHGLQNANLYSST